ncbi:hypothetical protein CDAR_306101 [Caerostris darwini]|uniref:Uncharacterized protein n=1 Tax=Caerostris darwini TaxID=1538125 RepID=A0AAV4PTY5_9ARAC|nr:hypothetical protein CDAR_306101 [Caerostris darwini]
MQEQKITHAPSQKRALKLSVSNSKNSKVELEARYLWCLQTNFFCKKSARAGPQLVSGRLLLKVSKHVIKMLNAERFPLPQFSTGENHSVILWLKKLITALTWKEI